MSSELFTPVRGAGDLIVRYIAFAFACVRRRNEISVGFAVFYSVCSVFSKIHRSLCKGTVCGDISIGNVSSISLDADEESKVHWCVLLLCVVHGWFVHSMRALRRCASGLWKVDEVPDTKYNHFPGDKALVISESHRHYAISRKLHGAAMLSITCAWGEGMRAIF